ncbi:cysteine hydrolase family protein [Nocardia stercoris]|uniref:Cysteine hydrolase n=1 Tax=Nocardia stercoris TaxID=2483361 RepID=A0A3M2L7R9_9NOCA|nr:cysteine hydrolase [Nocardia stercoris]RMI33597.1 cysteine hydrolase [Nocardia stercoris]
MRRRMPRGRPSGGLAVVGRTQGVLGAGARNSNHRNRSSTTSCGPTWGRRGPTLAGGRWYAPLAPGEGDVVAYEHWGMSGFANTDLDLQLRTRGIERVIIAGMTAPGCVEGTARHAMELGYLVTLVTDATAAYNDELMHAAHHLTGPLFAEHIRTTEEVIMALATVSE